MKKITRDELYTFISDSANKCSGAQAASLMRVHERWPGMDLPYYDSLNDCVMVLVTGGTPGNSAGMTLGIEKDGYTHS